MRLPRTLDEEIGFLQFTACHEIITDGRMCVRVLIQNVQPKDEMSSCLQLLSINIKFHQLVQTGKLNRAPRAFIFSQRDGRVITILLSNSFYFAAHTEHSSCPLQHYCLFGWREILYICVCFCTQESWVVNRISAPGRWFPPTYDHVIMWHITSLHSAPVTDGNHDMALRCAFIPEFCHMES